MSETDDNAADEVRTGPTPGELLRQGREASGLSLQEDATKLHLHQRIVEALEHDDEAQLPTPIYVRGYLRNYARLLGLDSEAVLAAYDARDNQHPELKPPVAAKNQASSSDKPVRAVTYLLTLGLVVLLLAWWQSRHLGEEGVIDLDSWQLDKQSRDTSVDESTTDSDVETVDSGLGYPIPIVRHPDGPAMGASTTEPEPPAPANADGEPLVEPPETPAPLATTTVGTDSETGSDAGTDAELLETLPEVGEPGRGNSGDRGLRLVIEEESWIEVYDADGKRLYLGLAEPGETVRVNGKPPLEVLLGYAPGVDVSYNGDTIDTIEQSQAGVAQFRVGD